MLNIFVNMLYNWSTELPR